MKKAILFDLDGTLTDSGEGILNCAQYAFQQMGYPVPPREEMGVFVGPPLWDTFEKFGIPKEQTDEAVRIFRSRYVPIGKFENTPYPGIRELLERLKEMGFHTAALALDERAISVAEPRLAREERLALILGTEGDGLAEETIARCDDTVMIPMSHGVDSLNVAAASAVAFWQLCGKLENTEE